MLREDFKSRGTGALSAAWFLGRNFGGTRLAELGQAAGDATYPAVRAAIKRFERRLLVDRDLQKKARTLQRILNINGYL